MREPRSSFVEHIAIWDWPGTSEFAILLCHATGFHGRCWDATVRLLPEDWRVVAMDLRGHGRSGNPDGPFLWKNHGLDVAMVVGSLGLDDVVAVGHSMGGHSVVHAATLLPEPFRALLLLDPVIRPREAYGTPWVANHFARKRRNAWASAEEMHERFRDRPPFNGWHPQVLRDYCDYGLRGNELACSPETEGMTYENSTAAASELSDALGGIAVPVWVMRSHLDLDLNKVDMNGSPCDPKLASRFQRGHDIVVPRGHFFPMEDPASIAERIRLIVGGR